MKESRRTNRPWNIKKPRQDPVCGKVEESVEYSHTAVFKGTYHHRIDAKGRLPIPAVFRRALGEGGESRAAETHAAETHAAETHAAETHAAKTRAPESRAAEARVVVTLLDQCLAIYPPGEWARLEAQLAALPAFNKQVKALTRLLTSRAADCEIDVQGRILLPPSLRQSASLTRDAVVVGVLNRFEVWSPDAWDGFVRESERLLDDVSLDIQWPLAPPAHPAGTPGGAPGGTPGGAPGSAPPATGVPPDAGSPQSKPNS